MTDLSIITVNYRNPALLRLFLKSLSRALPEGVSTEVVVVDSASTPETRLVVTEEAAAWFDTIQLVPFRENVGYTRGNNEGIRASSGQYVLLLNPDIVPTAGAIGELMTYLQEHPKTGLVGPQLLNFDGSRQDTCFRFMTPYTLMCRRMPYLPGAARVVRDYVMQGTDFSHPRNVDWIMGSAYMTTREAIDRVGMLDERLFHYMSDVEWPRRFWYHGLTVSYCPGARMYHYHQRESKGRLGIFDVLTRTQTRWHLRDALRYFRANGLTGARPTPA